MLFKKTPAKKRAAKKEDLKKTAAKSAKNQKNNGLVEADPASKKGKGADLPVLASKKKPAPARPKLKQFPLLPLRDVVIFPGIATSLFLGRKKSIKALAAAADARINIFVAAQRRPEVDEPTMAEIYEVGTVCKLRQVVRMSDGNIKLTISGNYPARIKLAEERLEGVIWAEVEPLVLKDCKDQEREVLLATLRGQIAEFIEKVHRSPPEVMAQLEKINDLERVVNILASQMDVPVAEKQKIIETTKLAEQAEKLIQMIEGQLFISGLERKLRSRVKKNMERSQREYYLQEQIKAAQRELGDGNSEADKLKAAIVKAKMPKETAEKCNLEVDKLAQMPSSSAEANVIRNYLDWMLRMPWKKKSRLKSDIDQASAILDADHYGLKEVKQRILEQLAVQARTNSVRGPILCLVGPPGVGKTSLGKSIARATGRKYARIALGGIHDEAEIRGHRRTYIGSLPGKIIQRMAKVGVVNPLLLFDEVDKLGSDWRGDPVSALLEALDPEQNSTFGDHYIEADYDLSNVLFICTANHTDIAPPLLDRMEVIELSGYIEQEKNSIAKSFLIPRQMERCGLKADELKITAPALKKIVRNYTREAGVRGLERSIARIARKVVLETERKKGSKSSVKAAIKPAKQVDENGLAKGAAAPQTQSEGVKSEGAAVKVTAKNLNDFLGPEKFRSERVDIEARAGVAYGLAWTETGGDILPVEAITSKGTGQITMTGSLGDVLKESIQAAMASIRARSRQFGLKDDFYRNLDIHVHLPEGAVPKDGPSAGAVVFCALLSSLTEIPIHPTVCLTGELTLRGRITKIGGLKEKILAAHRAGMKQVLIPGENSGQLTKVPEEILADIKVSQSQLDRRCARHYAGDSPCSKAGGNRR